MIDYMMELIRFRELAVLKDDVQVVKKGLLDYHIIFVLYDKKECGFFVQERCVGKMRIMNQQMIINYD